MGEPQQPEVVVANTSAQFEHDGQKVRIIKGRTTVEIGHPILKGRTHLFEPFTVDYPLPRQSSGRAATKSE